MQGEIEKSTTTGDFNTLLLVINISSKQKITKDTIELKSIINHLDLIHLIQQQYNTHSSQAHMEHSPRQTTL